MKLAIFGATGGTGQQVVEQALAAGHTVTVLVRDAAKLTKRDARLTVITGNVLNQADVDACVKQTDAVICTLGNTSNNPDMLVTNGTRNIITAMQQQGIQRLIVVSSLGVGDSKQQVPLFFKVVAATVLRKVMKDKEAQEEVVRASGLTWTLVRPGGLTDGPRTGVYQFGVDPTLKAGQVARADVADFILREVERNEFVRMAPAVV
jgi:putative NADH-flavin reductase